MDNIFFPLQLIKHIKNQMVINNNQVLLAQKYFQVPPYQTPPLLSSFAIVKPFISPCDF